jgi:hypothetical protein
MFNAISKPPFPYPKALTITISFGFWINFRFKEI